MAVKIQQIGERGCTTCSFFIFEMVNQYGGKQPFCKHPKMIEYNKEHREGWKGDLFFQPMSDYGVMQIEILGCRSHSKNGS